MPIYMAELPFASMWIGAFLNEIREKCKKLSGNEVARIIGRLGHLGRCRNERAKSKESF